MTKTSIEIIKNAIKRSSREKVTRQLLAFANKNPHLKNHAIKLARASYFGASRGPDNPYLPLPVFPQSRPERFYDARSSSDTPAFAAASPIPAGAAPLQEKHTIKPIGDKTQDYADRAFELASTKSAQLSTTVRKLRTSLEDLIKKQLGLKTQNQKLIAEKEKLIAQENKREVEIQSFKNEINRLRAQIGKLEKELTSLQEEKRSVDDQLRRATDDINRLQEQLRGQQQFEQVVREKDVELGRITNEHRRESERLKSEIQILTGGRLELINTNAELNQKIKAAEINKRQLESVISNHAQEMAKIKTELDKTLASLRKVQAELDEVRRESQALKIKNKELSDKSNNLEEQLKTAKEEGTSDDQALAALLLLNNMNARTSVQYQGAFDKYTSEIGEITENLNKLEEEIKNIINEEMPRSRFGKKSKAARGKNKTTK
tara:strand:- start:1481 stop:2782 length:1302 start_codon:yes stop_codon:yes gene_type:complete